MPSLLGKVVVQLRNDALLDRLHRHFIGNGLAGKLRLGVIGGIDDFGLQFLAGFGAAQDGVKASTVSLPPISTSASSPASGAASGSPSIWPV